MLSITCPLVDKRGSRDEPFMIHGNTLVPGVEHLVEHTPAISAPIARRQSVIFFVLNNPTESTLKLLMSRIDNETNHTSVNYELTVGDLQLYGKFSRFKPEIF